MIIDRSRPIAVVAPCHAYSPERLQQGIDIARGRGWDLHRLPDIEQRHRYHAGDDAHRLGQLVEALSDPRWGAVWVARGGSGLTRLLPKLDSQLLRKKPILGFSDVTALHLAVYRAGGVAVHCPVVHSLPSTDASSLEHLDALLDGRPTLPLPGSRWTGGDVAGPLVGGNLCLLAATCGTPWQLDARGAILVLEEIGEEPYRVDRLLQQLRSAGVFTGVAGLAVGEFLGCDDASSGWWVRDLIMELANELEIPSVGDLPIGHGALNHGYLQGMPAQLHGAFLSLGATS